MTNDWAVLDSISESGLYAVVVTATGSTTPIASGYAKSISTALAARYSDRDLMGVRTGQEGTGSAGTIEDSELNVLVNWLDGNAHPRRSGNKPSTKAILYVERFDLLGRAAASLLAQAKSFGLDLILVGAADASVPPNHESLSSFPTVLLINLPSTVGGEIIASEVSL